MITFVIYNLKSLFSPLHFLIIFVYFSFAWFLAQPFLDASAIYNSMRLTSYYDFILMSFGLLSFILAVLRHYRSALQRGRRELLAIRLSNHQIFWGLTTSYLLFFFIGFAVPSYLIAFVQQLVYAPNSITSSVFLLKMAVPFTGYCFFWLVAALTLFGKLRNDFVVLFLFVVGYIVSFILRFLSGGLVFDHYWFMTVLIGKEASWRVGIGSFLSWGVFLTVAYLYGNRIADRLHEIDLVEPFKNGVSVRLAEKLGAHFSAHHLKMMGLANQKILTLFALIGLTLVLVVLKNPHAELIILGKIYLGALLPILFSFNQYYIIQLDRDARMVHNNFLREISYQKIIFNRWMLLLLPQLLVALSFSLIVFLLTQKLSLLLIAYLILLNIFCSLLNLLFALVSRASGAANLMLLLFVYVQLREEVQTFFLSFAGINIFNIFYPLLQEESIIPTVLWVTVVGCIGMMALLIRRLLSRVSYYDLAFD
ncbi:MAG: hypothetical protein ACPL4I_11065 [Bacteroidota bacterium]